MMMIGSISRGQCLHEMILWVRKIGLPGNNRKVLSSIVPPQGS